MILGGSDSLERWLFLRLAMATLVMTAGVALLALAVEGFPRRQLLLCAGAQYANVLVGFSLSRRFKVWWTQLGELLLDVVIITAFVHFSGGVGSPFVLLYFFPVLLAAFSLGQKGALLCSMVAAGVFLGYAFISASGWIDLPEVVYRGGKLSSGALLRGHFAATLLLVVGYLAGEMSARIAGKARLLAHRSRELERAERETQGILENMSSGVLTLDRQGRIERMNKAAERILGVEIPDAVHRQIQEVLDARMPVLVRQLLDCLNSGVNLDRLELHVESSGGISLPIGLSISQQRDEMGDAHGIIAVFQDLSSVVRMREQMRTNDRLIAMGELSASIAHEIRNPLASIRGSVELLRGELHVEGENRRLMDLVLKESARLNRLIGDFLEYARLKPIRRRNMRLGGLLAELEVLISSREGFANRVRLALPEAVDELVVSLDEELMKQVFLNLAINAIDAMGDRGSLELAVSVNLVSEPQEVIVRFLDDGCGLDDDIIDRIFEPFFTTKASGTGLGLPLATRIVAGHEGRIEAKNRDGGGAEFSVHLPLVGIWRDGSLQVGGFSPAEDAGYAASWKGSPT